MWARLYDWYDRGHAYEPPNDMLVCAEWHDPNDGLHYVEVYVNPLDGLRQSSANGIDSIKLPSIEEWGGTIRN